MQTRCRQVACWSFISIIGCAAIDTELPPERCAPELFERASDEHRSAMHSSSTPSRRRALRAAIGFYSEWLEQCEADDDWEVMRFFRGEAFWSLRDASRAAEDYGAVAHAGFRYACEAAYSAVLASDCVEERVSVSTVDVVCIQFLPDQLGELPDQVHPGGPSRAALRLFEAIERYEELCEVRDKNLMQDLGSLLWRRARVHARYGQQSELARVLCRLAGELPDTTAGKKAKAMIGSMMLGCAR